MKIDTPTYVHSYSIISSLGNDLSENFNHILEKKSGLKFINDNQYINKEIPIGKINDAFILQAIEKYKVETRFDTLLLACLDDLQQNSSIDFSSKNTLIILSSTKGNIGLLENSKNDKKLALHYSANLLKEKIKNPNQPIVVSNACISGVSAIILAKRLLQNNLYKHIIVIGCDVLSKFVITGFNSFHAISNEVCKPFDKSRNGISVGESVAGMVLTTEIENEIIVQDGFISNDANHISGPSKTGEELANCIVQSMKKSKITIDDIDFISAHGTATIFNDEMESKAIEYAGLINNPVFSLKPFFGHTLGASGILETIISIECLKKNMIPPSLNYYEKGVSGNITINQTFISKPIRTFLKTTSGFGGCNAALLVSKN